MGWLPDPPAVLIALESLRNTFLVPLQSESTEEASDNARGDVKQSTSPQNEKSSANKEVSKEQVRVFACDCLVPCL